MGFRFAYGACGVCFCLLFLSVFFDSCFLICKMGTVRAPTLKAFCEAWVQVSWQARPGGACSVITCQSWGQDLNWLLDYRVSEFGSMFSLVSSQPWQYPIPQGVKSCFLGLLEKRDSDVNKVYKKPSFPRGMLSLQYHISHIDNLISYCWDQTTLQFFYCSA